MSIFEFDDQQGVRTRGTLHAPGATPGDVLTVGTPHGAVSPSPGGGSQPLIVRLPVAFNTPNLAVSTSPITAVNVPGKSVSIAGDYTARLRAGHSVQIVGSTGNDGGYTIDTATPSGGATVLVLVQALSDATVDGAVAGDQIGGLTAYQASEGDVLLTSMWSVTTAWDGSSPTGKLFVEGDDPFFVDISYDLTTPNSVLGQWSNIGAWDYRQQPLLFGPTPGPLLALVEDGVGNNPGSSQGAGEVILLVLPA